jgi:putative NADH-flavin reductase
MIVEEALVRRHEVLAVVRSGKEAVRPAATVLVRSLFELEYRDVADCDVIIDAFGTWTPESLSMHSHSLHFLCDLLAHRKNRLLVVGSAGSLFMDKEHTMRLVDSPDMPEMYKPLANAMAQAYDELRLRSDVNWTYFSPSAFFDAGAPRSGKFRLGRDELLADEAWGSMIGYADAAIAILDEAEQARFVNARFTAVRTDKPAP